jgi:hypothetical protein
MSNTEKYCVGQYNKNGDRLWTVSGMGNNIMSLLTFSR